MKKQENIKCGKDKIFTIQSTTEAERYIEIKLGKYLGNFAKIQTSELCVSDMRHAYYLRPGIFFTGYPWI